jgi:hypothetical protein
MRKTFYTVSFFFAVYFLLIRCNKNSNTCQWAAEPPGPIFFQIKKSGQIITDSTFLSAIRISYYQNNNKYYLTYLGVLSVMGSGTDYSKKGILYANIASVNNDSKTYYLEYPNNYSTQDTLHANYLTPLPSTNCQFKISAVSFNGQVPVNDLTDFPFSVYILNKP